MRLKNKDIAKKLGISTTAVSLAINNRPGVSEKTRKEVLRLLNESTRQSYQDIQKTVDSNGSILMVVHKAHGSIVLDDKPFFADVMASVQQEAMKQSYTLILTHYLAGQNLSDFIAYLKSVPADGIVLLGTELAHSDLTEYKKVGLPIVLLDASFELADVDSVTLDNQVSIFRAIGYGYEMGHRNIGYLKSNLFISNFGHRFDGFLKGIHHYNLQDFSHPVIELPCQVETAYQQMKEFLKNMPANFQMPTLFLADLDYIALGAMKALSEAGYRIPDDISIIGYDDVVACEISNPALTTIQVNRKDIGRLAINRLIQIIKTPADYYITTHVSSKLIIRDSVKDINKN